MDYRKKGKIVYRSHAKVGDLVHEKHHPDWMGVVLKEVWRDDEQFLVVEWLLNNNNVTNGNKEVISAKYIVTVKKRGDND